MTDTSPQGGAGSKPRLIMICHLPPPMTGAAMVSQYAVNSLRLREMFDCEVIPIRMASNVGDLGGMRLSKIWNSLAIHIRLLRLLMSRRADAVYITVTISGFALLRDYMTALICRAFGIRPILHMHMKGVSARHDRSRPYRTLYRSLFGAAEVIHLSLLLCRDVESVVRPERLHVVANGVPDPGSGAEAMAPLHENPRPPTMLFLSNMLREKGALDLLAASKCLHDEGLEHRLVFVGAEADRDVVAAIREATRTDGHRVAFTGPLYGREKDMLMGQADIFAFPSYYEHECQPLSIIEAMANGLAVVASRAGGIPDLLRDGVDGLLFDERDIDGLVDALRRLVSDARLRQALGQAARRSYLKTYTVEAFEERFVDTIAQIVKASEQA